MNDFFATSQEYLSILLEPSVVLFVGLLTILVTRNSTKHKVARDRLTYAYHPIFLVAESFLFKSITKSYAEEFIEKYNEIEADYSLYIYPSLRREVFWFSNSLKCDYDQLVLDEHWMNICKYIEKDYDKLCKLSHMPIRSTAYRLNTRQFSSKPSMYWGVFKVFFLPMTSFFAIWLLLLLLIGFTDFLIK